MTTRVCPECGRPLAPKPHRGIEVDVCTSCRGVWFDRTELGRALLGPGGRPTGYTVWFDETRLGPQGSRRERCPVCGTESLRVARWGDAEASKCDSCEGIWISARAIELIRVQLATLHPRQPVWEDTKTGGFVDWEFTEVLQVILEITT